MSKFFAKYLAWQNLVANQLDSQFLCSAIDDLYPFLFFYVCMYMKDQKNFMLQEEEKFIQLYGYLYQLMIQGYLYQLNVWKGRNWRTFDKRVSTFKQHDRWHGGLTKTLTNARGLSLFCNKIACFVCSLYSKAIEACVVIAKSMFIWELFISYDFFWVSFVKSCQMVEM